MKNNKLILKYDQKPRDQVSKFPKSKIQMTKIKNKFKDQIFRC